MGNVSHIGCPGCKGAVGFTNVDRIITCRFCGAKLLVESEDFVPEYHVETPLDATEARRALQRFLSGEAMPDGLLKHARFRSAQLCWVPYHEVKSRRLGTIEHTLRKSRYSSKPVLSDSDNMSGLVWKDEVNVTSTRETEVIMGDVHRIEPAVELEDFGVKDAGVFEGLKRDELPLFPFDRRLHGKRGRVYPPTIDHRKIMENLNIKGFTSEISDGTEYVETRVKRIFYPLWRLRFKFQGKLYGAVVDGVSGEVIFARVPQGDKARVMWLVAGVSTTGLLIGKLMAGLSFSKRIDDLMEMGFRSSDVFMLGAFLLGILVASMALSWLLVWNQFRYPGEVIKMGGELMVEKYSGLFSGRSRTPVFNLKQYLKNLVGMGGVR